VIISNKLSYHLLTLPPTGLNVSAEEQLAEVVSCQSPYGSFAVRMSQALLQNSEASTAAPLVLNGEETVEICFEQYFFLVLCW